MSSVETITEEQASTGKRAKKAKTANPKNQRKAKPAVTKKHAKSKAKSADGREGSKKAIVLAMLRRKEGATIIEIAKATGWQNHSIRGFISGTIAKKMGLNIESEKSASGERTYRLHT